MSSKYQLVTVDFESFFGTGCNIKDQGTSQYVTHPDFHLHCMAYKTPQMPEARVIRGEKINAFFKQLRANRDRIVLAGHNLYFDGYIAAVHYGFVPARYLCTMAMATPLIGQYQSVSLEACCQTLGLGDGKMKDVLPKWRNKRWADMSREDRIEMALYNKLDTELTEQLFYKLAPGFPREEFDIIDLSIRMFCDPAFEIDSPKAEAIIEEEALIKRQTCEAAGVEASQVRSNPQFAELLRAEGVEPPMKISPTTGKETYAFAQADLTFQALTRHENEQVKRLMTARLANKTSINESRAKAMLQRAGRKVPIYLGYCGAHTFRFSGGDRFNPQNLPRDGRLRSCLKAPDGYKVVAADASQIEARDNAVFSEQWDLVEEFRRGVDVYCSFASDIYGFEVNKDDNPDERFVGKTGILGLGYQCGAFKFQNMLEVGAFGPSVKMSEADVQKIVDTYRSKYYSIKATWWELSRMIPAMLPENKHPLEFRGLVFEPGGTILMPNGLRLHYPDLGYEVGEYGTAEFTYKPYDARFKKQIHKKLYGGSLLENCLAEGTEVLTPRGWVPIERITLNDAVHDGVEWVNHEGLIAKGLQGCVNIEGVQMTPDHEVLTDEGWKAASQGPRPYWPDLRGADSATSDPRRREESLLGFPLRVWKRMHQMWSGCDTERESRRYTKLRVLDQKAAVQEQHETRNERTSGIRRLAFDGGSVPVADPPGVLQLWGAWDYCLQTMVEVRELLGRYGRRLRTWVDVGPHKQRQRVLEAQLPLGKLCRTSEQPQRGSPVRHPVGRKGIRGEQDDAVLPLAQRPVYDILNAGPRQRFVVRGNAGPFIVHNCIQSRCRIMTTQHALKLSRYYKVALLVHDEVVMIVPENKAKACLRDAIEIMSEPPDWNPKIPLAAEGTITDCYVK